MPGIILFELNEVPARVLDTFVARRPQSAFAELLRHCRRIPTLTEDSSPLSPWITWPTLHRGVTDARHGILEFGQPLQEVDAEYPPLWQLAARAGLRVGVAGSLHTDPLRDDQGSYAFYLPDPFAASPRAHPKLLESFQRLNLEMSRASGRNVSRRIPARAALGFAARLPRLGIQPGTMAATLGQLADEVRRPHRRNRRRTVQALLSFDVFFNQLEKRRPQLATFFSNHVASAMHRYWAASFPADYASFHYEDAWVARFQDEIDYAMLQADSMLRRLLRLSNASADYQVWVATSMGQAATFAEPVRTQLYVTALPTFAALLGLRDGDYRSLPSMLPQYNFMVEERCADTFEQQLRALRVGEETIGYSRRGSHFRVHLGQVNLPTDTRVSAGNQTLPLSAAGLGNIPIEDQTNTNAYHIPEGLLLVYDPVQRVADHSRTTLSTTAIAPTLLAQLGVPKPSHMIAPAWLPSTR